MKDPVLQLSDDINQAIDALKTKLEITYNEPHSLYKMVYLNTGGLYPAEVSQLERNIEKYLLPKGFQVFAENGDLENTRRFTIRVAPAEISENLH